MNKLSQLIVEMTLMGYELTIRKSNVYNMALVELKDADNNKYVAQHIKLDHHLDRLDETVEYMKQKLNQQ